MEFRHNLDKGRLQLSRRQATQSPSGVALPRAGAARPVGTSRGRLPVGASSAVAIKSCIPVDPPRGCGHARAATWPRCGA